MTFKCQQKWQLDPPTQFNADVIYGCFLLLYFWQSSCRLGNCMSVWTQYENFNFIPAKKAIFKGQKMTSFPEIKSCYTINKSKHNPLFKAFWRPREKSVFKNPMSKNEWVQNLFKIALQVYSCDFALYFQKKISWMNLKNNEKNLK